MNDTHGSSSSNPNRPARKPSLRQRFFEWVYRWVRYRAWWVLFLGLLLSMLALYAVRDLPIRESMLDLLPKDDELVERFKLRISELQQSDSLIILLQLDHPPASLVAGEQRLQPIAEQIVLRLRLHEGIQAAGYQLDPKIVTFEELADDPARLAELEAAVAALQAGSGGFTQLIGQQDFAEEYEQISAQILDFIEGLGEGKNMDLGLFGELIDTLQDYNARWIEALGQFEPQLQQTQERVDALQGLLRALESDLNRTVLDVSPDGRSLRIVVQPGQPSYVSLQFNKQVVQAVQETLDAILPRGGDVRRYVAGNYSFTAESNQIMRLDMFNTTLISIAGIALIFLLTFRGVLYPLLIVIPLSMGTVWMTAWAKYVLGGYNLITSLLPSLLLGLGINYGIFFLSRFLEARQAGKGVSGALHEAILYKGDAMLSSAITTALVFFVMMLSRSNGLYEMGLVAGFGVLVSVFLTLFLLPALIVVSHLVLRRRLHRPPGYRWQLSWVVQGVLRARLLVIALFLLLTAGIVGPAAQVRIQFVTSDLMVSGLPTQQAREVIRAAGFSEDTGDYFLFFLPSQDQAEQLEEALRSMDLVMNVRSVRDYLKQTAGLQALDLETPFAEGEALIQNLLSTLGNKQAFTQRLQEMETLLLSWKGRADTFGLRDIAELLNTLISQLRQIQDGLNRLNVNDLQISLVGLQNTLNTIKSIISRMPVLPKTIEDFLVSLPEDLRSRFITEDNNYIVYVQVNKNIYLEGNYERFADAVDPITTNYVGVPMVQHRLEMAMESDFWVSTLGALGLIVLSLFVDFSSYRMWSAPLFVLLPLIVGYAWMLGGMGLLKLSFNLTNMVISPLLIGIGVDNGIHLLHRYLERRDDPQRLQHAAQSVVMPVVIANLCTMAAFGSLLFASTPGLPSLGKSAMIGVGSVALCSLTLLPAVLAGRR